VELKEAWDKLIDEIAKELRLYDILDWVSDRVNKYTK